MSPTQRKSHSRKKMSALILMICSSLFFMSSSLAFAQRFQWPTPAAFSNVAITGSNGSTGPYRVVEASDGNYLVAFSNSGDIHVQKIDASDGSDLWASGGAEVSGTAQTHPDAYFDIPTSHIDMIPDASGGAYIVWAERDSGGTTGDGDIFVQHLDSSGSKLWGANGVRLFTGGAPFEGTPFLLETPTNLFLAYTYSNPSPASRTTWVVALNKSTGAFDSGFNGGSPIRADDGLSGGRKIWGMVSDGGNGAIVVYTDTVGIGQVYASRINTNGTKAWEHIQVSTGDGVNDGNHRAAIAPDGSGGAIIAWRYDDGIFGNTYIETQKINSAGALQWSGGNPISVETLGDSGDADAVQMVSDGSGGAYLLYEKDYSSTTPLINTSQTYTISRIDSSGTLAFSSVELIPANLSDYRADATGLDGRPLNIDLAADGSALVTWNQCWTDCNNDFGNRESRIEVRKVSSSGTVSWLYCHNQVDEATQYHDRPIVRDIGTSDAMITWASQSSGNVNVQYISDDSVTAPNGISDLAASSTTPGEVDLTWSDPGTPGLSIIDYVGFYSTDGFSSDSNLFTDGLSTNTNMTIDGLQNGIEYTFDVRACNQVLGPASNNETSTPSACAGSSNQFCGSQTISSTTLTFQDIPDTFNFGTITEGSSQDLFSNDNPGGSNPPDADDLLQILDDRGSGGFTLTVDPEGTFIEETATYTIPLANLYMVSSLDETDPGNVGGVTYGVGFTGDQMVSAPLYVDVDSADLTSTTTYTSLAPSSQFGGSPLVLMDGTLPAASGRDGTMAMFTNFHLHIDPSQQEGSYALKLTYTLSDSTT